MHLKHLIAALIEDAIFQGENAAVRFGGFFFVCDFEFEMNGVAEVNGAAVFDGLLEESEGGAFKQSELIDLSGCDSKHKDTVRDTFAEGGSFAVLLARVQRIIVTRDAREIHNIRFRHRTFLTNERVTYIELFKIQPARFCTACMILFTD